MYIGKTENVNPNIRWNQHKSESKKDRSRHRALYKAINKYGIENFIFEIIEETDNPKEREMYYIALYDTYYNGYNETFGGDGAAYLNLPEDEICVYYLNNHTLKETCEYYGHDYLTIKKILYKHNVDIINSHDVMKQRTSKPVAKIDIKSEEIINIYPSIMEAERQNPKGNGHIKDVCHGKRQTAGGYKWKFIE